MPRRLRKVHSLNAASCGEKPLLWRVGNLPRNPRNLAKGSKGNLTKYTDPVGRETVYEYDPNDIDLLRVKQKNPESPTGYDLLTTYTYRATDPPHLPGTITDASGQTTTLTYNARGQLETITTPPRAGIEENRTTTYSYDDNGYLERVTGPATGATGKFTYDAYGRVRLLTDSDEYAIKIDYDAMDRPMRVTYPDETFEEVVYNRLDAESRRDRLGRWSHTAYDALRRPVMMRDPQGRTVTLQWCSCGSLEKSIDANGNPTTWERDLESRTTKEIRANGIETLFIYENTTSRVMWITDPKGQHKDYNYFLDNSLSRIAYPNPAEYPTAEVSFSYDPSFSRLVSMVDGTGTTTYGYHPIGSTPPLGAGRLASVDGPLPNDTIMFTYDELGRPVSRSIGGVGATRLYDVLGRVRIATNPLGSFTYTYDGTTERALSVSYSNGQTTRYTYHPNSGDLRLKEIHNSRSNGETLSRFNYMYDVVGNVTVWSQQTDGNTAKAFDLGYDAADQLSAATWRTTDLTPVILTRNVYSYDASGNRTTEQIDDGPLAATYDRLNRLISQQPGGALRFKGTVNEASMVTVQGKPAQVTADNKFDVPAQVTAGTNIVEVNARDYSGNERTNTYELNVAGSSKAYTYDANGNLKSDGTRTFEWDAEDRLLAVNQGAKRSEFTYDGVSHRVRIVEKNGGTITADRRLLWCGAEICEERDSAGSTVMKRFYSRGVQESDQSYFYAFDHLGSVREMTDGAESLRARYDYEVYGKRSLIGGDKEADFGFTGHYEHSVSGLTLAVHRAYDSSVGRWISEDLIRDQSGDANLYTYVHNSPVGSVDLLGLAAWKITQKWTPANIKAYSEYMKKFVESYKGNIDCADLALKGLVKFASEKGLPVNLRNLSQHSSYDAASDKFNTPEQYMSTVMRDLGALHVIDNSRPVSVSDLQPGDLLMSKWGPSLGHTRIVTDVSANPANPGNPTVTWYKGNLPPVQPVQEQGPLLNIPGGSLTPNQIPRRWNFGSW